MGGAAMAMVVGSGAWPFFVEQATKKLRNFCLNMLIQMKPLSQSPLPMMHHLTPRNHTIIIDLLYHTRNFLYLFCLSRVRILS